MSIILKFTSIIYLAYFKNESTKVDIICLNINRTLKAYFKNKTIKVDTMALIVIFFINLSKVEK